MSSFFFPYRQHRNTSLDESSELQQSHNSEYLDNNNTVTNSAESSVLGEEPGLARKTLFLRRSSTGSNDDLGV